jgi:hypothetical protein
VFWARKELLLLLYLEEVVELGSMEVVEEEGDQVWYCTVPTSQDAQTPV